MYLETQITQAISHLGAQYISLGELLQRDCTTISKADLRKVEAIGHEMADAAGKIEALMHKLQMS